MLSMAAIGIHAPVMVADIAVALMYAGIWKLLALLIVYGPFILGNRLRNSSSLVARATFAVSTTSGPARIRASAAGTPTRPASGLTFLAAIINRLSGASTGLASMCGFICLGA